MELVRRLTITERPGYVPDGYGFVQKVMENGAHSQLSRLLFQIDCTQTSLTELRSAVDRIMGQL